MSLETNSSPRPHNTRPGHHTSRGFPVPATSCVAYPRRTQEQRASGAHRAGSRERAREAAALAIVREVATEDTLAYEGDAGDDYRCVFCGGHFDWRDGYEHTVPMREQMDDIPRALIHAPDCPVTKARALLADEEH